MSVCVYAPGRVNLLGEHVDYNGGFVLPAAIDRFVTLQAQPSKEDVFTIRALNFKQEVSFRLDDLAARRSSNGNPFPAWALYPAGVCQAFLNHGFRPVPVTASFSSTIPPGAGLSSSAAIETAFGFIWQYLGGWSFDRMKLAEICLEAEVRYVGVNCGIMDQFASLHGKPGHVLFLDTKTLEWEAIPLPGTALVVANTGFAHQLGEPAASSYNQRREECNKSLQILKSYLPDLQTLRDLTPQDLEKYEHALPGVLRKRVRHVVDECKRVLTGVDLLRRQKWQEFGGLMYDGHASLRDLFEVSSPQLDALVETAASLPGCLGSRLTGAGFGGSTINLVKQDSLDTFMDALAEGYHRLTGLTAGIFVVNTTGGARVEESAGV